MSVARVGGRAIFPARFRLVGTMNLCPCGGRGDPALACTCAPARLASYRERLSRALLDRFDLVVAMPRPRAAELAAPPGEPSAPVRERVVAGPVGARAHAAAADPGGLRAARPSGRPAAALRSRSRPRGAGRTHDRRSRRVRRGRAGARRRGSLVSLACGAPARMTTPARSPAGPCLPAAPRSDPRSAGAAVAAWRCRRISARDARGRNRRRQGVLGLRSCRGAAARARARRVGRARRERVGSRYRR